MRHHDLGHDSRMVECLNLFSLPINVIARDRHKNLRNYSLRLRSRNQLIYVHSKIHAASIIHRINNITSDVILLIRCTI